MKKEIKKVEDYSSYCYDLVASKINIGAEKAIAMGGNSLISGWSPNNIRRLVVSPDGFIVQYHTNSSETKNTRLVDVVLFRDRNKLEKCFSSDKYKPMVTTLVGSRICSSIEEIVYLTKVGDSGLSLPTSEAQVGKLVTGYNSSNGDIYKVLGSRFVRLKALITLNMTLQEFYKTFGDKLKESTTQLSDIESISKFSKVVNVEWWKSTYLRGSHYTPDMEGGFLYRHFEGLKEKKEMEIREAKLSRIKGTNICPNSEILSRANDSLSFIRKAFVGLSNQLSNDKTYGNAPRELSITLASLLREGVLSSNEISVTEGLSRYTELTVENRDFISRIVPSNGTECDLTSRGKESLAKVIDTFSYTLYKSIVEFTLSTIVKFGEEYPMFVRVKLKGVSADIWTPADMVGLVDRASEYLGGDLVSCNQGTQKVSLANCLYIMTLLCVEDTAVYDKSKFTKEFWLSTLSK